MTIVQTDLPGLLIVKKSIYEDNRGYFMEIYNLREWDQLGLPITFVQDNMSVSKKGTLRGLHYQKVHPQGKLVSVLHGEIYDVAVDLREGGATFGQWRGFRLSSENHKQLFIPAGFAHGFLCLSDQAIVHYKATDFYYPGDEGSIAWDDSKLNIAWPVKCINGVVQHEMKDGTPLTLSLKDDHATSFDDYCNSLGK